MKAFQKFILLTISSFIVVGIFKLSAGMPFFEEFTLDIYGFLAITSFIIPALVYVFVYEKILVYKKKDLKKPIGLDVTFFISWGVLLAIHYVFSFLLLYFETGKIEYSLSESTASALNIFLLLGIASDLHKKNDSIPIIRLDEKPVFYLKFFLFLVLFVCAAFLIAVALFTVELHKKVEVTSMQYSIDSIMYAIMTVSLAFFIMYILNRIAFFRKNILLPTFASTIIIFLAIKFLGFPIDYFRVVNQEYMLEMITFLVCLITINFPIAQSKRKLKINKLTSNLSKKEAEYLQLKNQINPHFLFNNLNVLVSFIELDPKKAIDFGHHLSNVYRHYLKNQTEDYVSLQGEINFITEYLSIYKAKFEKGFSYKMPQQIAENQYILPNCLQELIDNIFKHNVVEEEIPLEIEIFLQLNTLVIQNTINKKEVEIASNFGLENIKKRYLLLTNNDIQIIETLTHFSVKIPILELEA